MITDFKFGITERGDAALDFLWTKKMHIVIGAIIISKSASVEFENELLKFKDKCIYHATCTGLGCTVLEPNVPNYKEKLAHIERLILRGFPRNQIVIRIDPILPRNIIESVEKYTAIDYIGRLQEILDFAEKNGINRIRYSYLDLYEHNIFRLKHSGITFDGNGSLGEYEIELERLNSNLVYESCCERKTPDWHKVGCISDTDLKVLNLYNRYAFTYPITNITNSFCCKCPTQKWEMLNSQVRCQHGCLYCYWKDKEK